MVTPLDVVCMQIINAAHSREEVHYHLANPPLAHPQSPLEEAPFHIVDRTISMSQIGFDYYENTVVYRV